MATEVAQKKNYSSTGLLDCKSDILVFLLVSKMGRGCSDLYYRCTNSNQVTVKAVGLRVGINLNFIY